MEKKGFGKGKNGRLDGKAGAVNFCRGKVEKAEGATCVPVFFAVEVAFLAVDGTW